MLVNETEVIMTPEAPINPCAPRPITPGEYRFLSRIGRDTD